MKAVLQRVTAGSVTVADQQVARIAQGLVILLGVQVGDTRAEAEWLAEKCSQLRIFDDEQGKLNRSLIDVGGEALVVSQFTLLADTSRGRRPSYIQAAQPQQAEPLVEAFIQHLRLSGIGVQSGVFGAQMRVEISNDGPVTIVLERSATDQQRSQPLSPQLPG